MYILHLSSNSDFGLSVLFIYVFTNHPYLLFFWGQILRFSF